MIYLAHPSGAIEVCESTTGLARLERKGFVRCSPALHKACWRRKDRRAFERLWARLQTAPLGRERVVGE